MPHPPPYGVLPSERAGGMLSAYRPAATTSLASSGDVQIASGDRVTTCLHGQESASDRTPESRGAAHQGVPRPPTRTRASSQDPYLRQSTVASEKASDELTTRASARQPASKRAPASLFTMPREPKHQGHVRQRRYAWGVGRGGVSPGRFEQMFWMRAEVKAVVESSARTPWPLNPAAM